MTITSSFGHNPCLISWRVVIGLHCFIILLLQEWKKKKHTLFSWNKKLLLQLNRTGKQSLQMQGVVCLLCISISWLLDTIVLHFKKICHLLFCLLCSSISLLLNTIVFHFKRTAILFLWHGIKQTYFFFFLWNYQKPKVTFSTSYSSKCSCKEQKW